MGAAASCHKGNNRQPMPLVEHVQASPPQVPCDGVGTQRHDRPYSDTANVDDSDSDGPPPLRYSSDDSDAPREQTARTSSESSSTSSDELAFVEKLHEYVQRHGPATAKAAMGTQSASLRAKAKAKIKALAKQRARKS